MVKVKNMKKEKKLFKDTILYSIAQFSSAGLQFLVLPIYTRYFTPATFGQWDVLLATVTILLPIISLELSAATYRWLLDDTSGYTEATIITTGWRQLLKNMLIFSLIVMLIQLMIDIPYFWEILVWMNLLLMTQFLQQCARGLQRNTLFASLLFLPTAIAIVFIISSIFFFPLGIHAFLYGNILALAMTSAFAFYRLSFYRYMKGPIHQPLLHAYISYALPIIPAAISWILMTMLDRVIITTYLGAAANGIYAIALKIPAILLMCNTIFSLAWKDSVLTYYDEKDNPSYFLKTHRYYVFFLGCALILFTILAKPIISRFIGQAFHEAWHYSGLLLLAVFFQSLALFWAAIFHGAKKTPIILYSTLLGVLLNLILNILLVTPYGLYGVSIASIMFMAN